MFVEVTRLFTVVLLTAAGFMIGKDLAPASAELSGIGGMLGCLVGYLTGGVLGRTLERAVGVVERRVDRVPLPQVIAGMVGGGIGAVFGLTVAVPLALTVRPAAIAIGIGGLLVWFTMYIGFRVAARKSEELFAMAGLSTRPLVRARPVRRRRRLPRRLVRGDGRPAAAALAFGSVPRRPARAALHPRRAAGHGRRERRTLAPRPSWSRDPRAAAPRGAEPRVRGRRRGPGGRGGRCQAPRPRPPLAGPDPHQRHQPGQGRRAAGGAGDHSAQAGGRPHPRGPRRRDPARRPHPPGSPSRPGCRLPRRRLDGRGQRGRRPRGHRVRLARRLIDRPDRGRPDGVRAADRSSGGPAGGRSDRDPPRRHPDRARPLPRPLRQVSIDGCRPGPSSSRPDPVPASVARSSSSRWRGERLVDRAVAERNQMLQRSGRRPAGRRGVGRTARRGVRRRGRDPRRVGPVPGSRQCPRKPMLVLVHDAARPLASRRASSPR